VLVLHSCVHNQCISTIPFPLACMLQRHRHSCKVHDQLQTCHTEPRISVGAWLSTMNMFIGACDRSVTPAAQDPANHRKSFWLLHNRPGFTHTRKIAAGHLHARHCTGSYPIGKIQPLPMRNTQVSARGRFFRDAQGSVIAITSFLSARLCWERQCGVLSLSFPLSRYCASDQHPGASRRKTSWTTDYQVWKGACLG
jgi:hypothetical protein